MTAGCGGDARDDSFIPFPPATRLPICRMNDKKHAETAKTKMNVKADAAAPANDDSVGVLSGPINVSQQLNEQSSLVAGDNSKEISHLTEPWKHSRLHQLFSPQALENMFQKPLGLYTNSSVPEQQQFHTCHDPSSFLGDGDSFFI